MLASLDLHCLEFVGFCHLPNYVGGLSNLGEDGGILPTVEQLEMALETAEAIAVEGE